MFNSQKPTLEELPSSAQLIRSTVIAALSAAVILVTVVLPAEYGIDPTRIGRILGLTEMGEIKSQLAEEAEMDRQMQATDEESSLLQDLFGIFVGGAHAEEAQAWTDEVSFTLEPGEGIEWKLAMEKDGIAQFRWGTDGGRVNFDLHGDGADGQSVTYEKGRGQTGAEGDLVAAFTGNHGWFWRNRDNRDVTVTLQVRGAYSELKQMN